jgi:hypothetical protein
MFKTDGWEVIVDEAVGSLIDIAHVKYCSAPEVYYQIEVYQAIVNAQHNCDIKNLSL